MRDDQILNLHNDEKKRLAIIYRQVMFIQTRIEAYETVLSNRWNVLRGTFDPQSIKKLVDMEQLRLIRKHDEEVRENEEKNKQERLKPKLSIISPNGILK